MRQATQHSHLRPRPRVRVRVHCSLLHRELRPHRLPSSALIPCANLLPSTHPAPVRAAPRYSIAACSLNRSFPVEGSSAFSSSPTRPSSANRLCRVRRLSPTPRLTGHAPRRLASTPHFKVNYFPKSFLYSSPPPSDNVGRVVRI